MCGYPMDPACVRWASLTPPFTQSPVLLLASECLLCAQDVTGWAWQDYCAQGAGVLVKGTKSKQANKDKSDGNEHQMEIRECE